MSHSLHRHGTREQLQHDYTFYARTSRYVNREGCGPKLRRILSVLLEEQRVNNFGSSHAGKSYVAGLKPDEYALTLDPTTVVDLEGPAPVVLRHGRGDSGPFL